MEDVPDQIRELGDEQVERKLTARNHAFGDKSGGEVAGDHSNSKFLAATASTRREVNPAVYLVPTGTNQWGWRDQQSTIIVPIGSQMDERKKRRRGRPRSIDRQRTIKLALDNYWQEGMHALSLNELCRRSRISKPALYREFGGEDGLMEAVLTHYRALVIVPVLEALTTNLPFPELMEALIVGMTAERATPAGCVFTEMRLARSRIGPMTAASLEAVEAERKDAFQAWYQRAIERDEVNAAISPELAAGYIDTQFTTLLLQLGMGEPPDLVREQARLALCVLHSGLDV